MGGVAEPTFCEGDFVLLVDRNGRHYLFRLQEGATYHFHLGRVPHASILGRTEGIELFTTLGKPVWIYRARLQDYLVHMPRNSTIMYPKDIAFMLMWADVFPGARVFEAGAGSGALSLALLRAIGPEGTLVTYERREDMIARATSNVEAWNGPSPNWTLRLRDAAELIDDGPFDRAVLDLPDPGAVAPYLADALRPGGIVCSYVPNVTQVMTTVEAYRASGHYVEIETFETSYRPWLFRAPSARPEHAAIGHTGFLTLARRAGEHVRTDGPPTPEPDL